MADDMQDDRRQGYSDDGQRQQEPRLCTRYGGQRLLDDRRDHDHHGSTGGAAQHGSGAVRQERPHAAVVIHGV